MKYNFISVYQQARESAGLTQEQAAELINKSVRSVSDYENAITIPSDEVVSIMMTAYKAEWLGYIHLQTNSEVGKRCLPEIKLSNVACSALKLDNETKNYETLKDAIFKIAEDGVIDSSEEKEWDGIVNELRRIVSAYMSVIIAKKDTVATVPQ